jgi:DNA gyrase inhibitor GyrI
MDEELVLVSNPTGEDSCILIYGDDPDRIEWACARLDTCGSASGAAPQAREAFGSNNPT